MLPDRRRALAVSMAAPAVNEVDNAALLTVLNKHPAVRGSELAIASCEASCLKVGRSDGDGPQIARLLRHIADTS